MNASAWLKAACYLWLGLSWLGCSAGEPAPEGGQGLAGTVVSTASPVPATPMPSPQDPQSVPLSTMPFSQVPPQVGESGGDKPSAEEGAGTQPQPPADGTPLTIAMLHTAHIGPLLGVDASQKPDSRSQSVYGTDLGLPVMFGDRAVLLFGDSYGTAEGDFNPGADDIAGFFPLTAGSVDQVPAITLQSDWMRVKPQATDQALDMGPARTPVAAVGFGDSPWYAMFLRGGSFVECDTDADCGGLTCDPRMGVKGELEDEGFSAGAFPCLRTTQRDSTCAPPRGFAGLCRDTTSPLAGYDAGGDKAMGGVDAMPRTATGLASSVAMRHQFGQVAPADRGLIDMTHYRTSEFITNKFINATMRATRSETDFRMPGATLDDENVVWMWGRPAFWADPGRGAPGLVYLTKSLKPAAAEEGMAPRFEPLYFAGMRPAQLTAAGQPLPPAAMVPEWTPDQSAAMPLPAMDGWQMDSGVTGHMSVVYIEELDTWIMLYGGGMPSFWHVLFGEEVAQHLGDQADGPVSVRVARQPWGPWSTPKQVLTPDDAAISTQITGRSGSEKDAEAGLVQAVSPKGILYSAQLFEPWTKFVDERSVELAWFVSTWNPYQVQQMKTVITFE